MKYLKQQANHSMSWWPQMEAIENAYREFANNYLNEFPNGSLSHSQHLLERKYNGFIRDIVFKESYPIIFEIERQKRTVK